MNNNARNLSRDFETDLERERKAVAAVQYLIYYPEIYKEAVSGYGFCGMNDVIKMGEEKNANQTRKKKQISCKLEGDFQINQI